MKLGRRRNFKKIRERYSSCTRRCNEVLNEARKNNRDGRSFAFAIKFRKFVRSTAIERQEIAQEGKLEVWVNFEIVRTEVT